MQNKLKVLVLFSFLTLVTQVGGLIYLISIAIAAKLIKNERSTALRTIKRIALHITVYLVFTFLIVPPVAALFGRVALPAFEDGNLRPRTIWTAVLNRRYVRPQLKELVMANADQMGQMYPNIKINYFDANFPFSLRNPLIKKGFPLFPHLSHNDGKKLDLGFIYDDAASGSLSDKTPSAIGYGISEEPLPNERNKANECKSHWMYSFMRNLYPQSAKKNYIFNQSVSTKLITLFVKSPSIERVLLEPHLTARMKLNFEKVREVQCGSVRHDDHFHVQVY